MLKLNTNAKRQPYGGHHYPEYGVTFKGETASEVIKQVAKFRLSNNIPAGDPEQDVLLYYAKNWPWLVKGSPFFRDTMVDADYDDWRAWIYDQWKNPGSTITTKEASQRWEICAKCPFNKAFAWKATDEIGELKKRTFLLRRGVDIPLSLGFCARHRADLGVLTFLKEAEKFSKKKEKDNFEACWLESSLRDHKAAPVTQ